MGREAKPGGRTHREHTHDERTLRYLCLPRLGQRGHASVLFLDKVPNWRFFLSQKDLRRVGTYAGCLPLPPGGSSSGARSWVIGTSR